MPELLEHQRLIVNHKTKLIELADEYKIRDEQGNEVGVIRREGQSRLRKLLRLVSSMDAVLPVSLSVYDAGGRKVAGLWRGATISKSEVEVTDGGGAGVGRLVQENIVGKARFRIEGAGGIRLGEMKSKSWWSWDFAITDLSGMEVARITRKWAGLRKGMFPTADNYVVELARVTGPLRVITLAAAAGLHTALKQSGG